MSAMGGLSAGRPRPIAITRQDYGADIKDLERHWRSESKKLKDSQTAMKQTSGYPSSQEKVLN